MESFSKDYFVRLVNAIHEQDYAAYDRAIELVRAAWQNGRQIITLGNGGSSMTALHFQTDWAKNIYLKTGKRFRGRSLVDNMGLIMAYANDFSFEDLFAEQLKNILEHGDLVVAISGSGNSENVIRAVEYANAHGAVTLGLCGYDGGRLKMVAQHHLWANIPDMQIVEDIHAVFGHLVLRSLATSW
jgi:D-sedoheptulose 7-phosphate isomerase